MAQKYWGRKYLPTLLWSTPILIAGLCAQTPASGQEQGAVAREVRIEVAPHSSRWDYPREVILLPGQKLHIVEKGDTLWDLGQKYIGSPYAWPQIWELNKSWILDPHWIYPGDPLLVPGDGQILSLGDVEPVDDIAYLIPDERVIRLTEPAYMISYIFAFNDYLQLPYLVPKGANAHFRDIGAIKITGCQKEDRTNLSKGDVIYLGGGQDKGLQVGDEMMVLKVAKTNLSHPEDKLGLKPMGDVIQHVAKIRVLSVHPKNAEAVIEDTLDAVQIGEYAVLYQEPVLIEHKDAEHRTDTLEPIPLKTTAQVIYCREGAIYMSNGSLVLIDKGTNAGLKVGDVLLSVRGKQLESGGQNGKSPQTNRYLGQMLVVRADRDSATCLIIFTKSEMTLGDIVTN